MAEDAPVAAPGVRRLAPRRYAAIDCGTNSVKLIVADLSPDEARPVFELSEVTRIGEGMRANGLRLRDVPMERTLCAIEEFAAAAKEHGALEIAVIGTAALRDAGNTADFVARVRERAGLRLEVITGEEEARLSFLAVRRDPHWRRLPQLLVIDIGGGSTELIQGEAGGDGVQSRTSVNLGAVKLTEEFLGADRPSGTDVAAARAAAAEAFAAVRLKAEPAEPYHIVGVGGTLTNLGAMTLAVAPEPEALHGLSLRAADLEGLCARLSGLTLDERRAVAGLDPRRADIILAGTILLIQALKTIRSDRIDISTRGLRWGLLYDRFLPEVS
jgi:exopolyphosphatase/guanosine-5'-triphosphate,3'-diphosphate pyrophosphatase